MRPPVTVVVLNYNNLDDTVACLDSVCSSDYPDFNVILVDNHSTDGSIDEIKSRFPQLRYVDNPRNLGVAGGRNAGWAIAKNSTPHGLLLFLDNDTVLEPDTLSVMAAFMEDNADAAVVCGKTYTAPPSRTIMSAGISVNLYTGKIRDIGCGEPDDGRYDAVRCVPACGGFAFMVRRNVYDELGGLDEAFNPYGWEDVDFCLRAGRHGYRCYYVADAVLYHKGCKIGRGYVPLYEKYKVKHFILLVSRHATPLQKVCCCLCVTSRAILMLVRNLAAGNFEIVSLQFRGAWASIGKAKRHAG